MSAIAAILIVPVISCTSVPVIKGNGSSNAALQGVSQPAPQNIYYDGDGGSGISIAVLTPKPTGLTQADEHFPALIQGILVGDFTRVSAIDIFDRQAQEKIILELEDGIYSESDDFLRYGEVIPTQYMLVGEINRTPQAYILNLRIADSKLGRTRASHQNSVDRAAIEDFSAIKKASEDLLSQMGVDLTAAGKQQLLAGIKQNTLNSETALARGITAQRQGTEVAALTYYFQAAAFDASLVEAVSRTKVLSTNISTGNIGANVRNDITWRSDWVRKLTETETFINNMLWSTIPQRSIWYTTNIQEREGARDYTRETTELSIEAALHTHAVFPVSVQKTVQAVYDGLQTTGRAQAWGLNNWPRSGVTNNNPFNSRWGSMVSIAFELLNEQNQVIGRQTVEMDPRFSFSGTRLEGPGTVFTTVRFTGVNAYAISDRLNIRIASINGSPPEAAGISQIESMSSWQMQTAKEYTIYNGMLNFNSNNRNLGNFIIPAELWGERVTSIANEAFERRGLTSVVIPEGVDSIGDKALAFNDLASVTIGTNVNFDYSSFDYGFNSDYNKNDRKGGVYYKIVGSWVYSTQSMDEAELKKIETKDSVKYFFGFAGRVLLSGALLVGVVFISSYLADREKGGQ